ncbi:Retroelement pol Polyprotein [Phytophthora megakarya]|uniref:Retroelement pol Polyprotein n=1 Tax=Phytophthora megakarya TaxID=4795 RepID=A0A225VYF1_9STRA|nr:Retroelement pol Polyprotein [Phytophthora megakarya]
MNELKERNCKVLPDNISKFRHLITQVKEMSEPDKIMHFLLALDYDRFHSHSASDGARDRPRYRSYDHKRSKRNDDGQVPMEIDNQLEQKQMARLHEDGEDVNTIVMDRVTMNVAGIQEQADELQGAIERMRKEVEKTFPAVSETTEQADLCGLQSVVEPELHAMHSEDEETGACGSPPEQETGLHTTQSADDVAQRFDGTLTPPTDVKHVEAPVSMDGYFFPTMKFVEWKLSESHDVILGKPWFEEFNPQENWQTEEVIIPKRMKLMDVDGPTFTQQLEAGKYEQVLRVKLQIEHELDGIPGLIRKLSLKKGAQPSTRVPFRMSKMEQDAFEEFVRDKFQKGWIEVSNSTWISNIFAIAMKDPVTGKMPKRAEWLRSGNQQIQLRWVFDYQYLNSVTVIPKIPLPLIEELFDKMVGCVVYTLINLTQGYHQKRVIKSSRPYTAFRTHKETYQWCVTAMGVAGMLGTGSRLMHALYDTFEFVVVYLDDTCVFSKRMEEHVDHIRAVCEVLRREQLYAHLAKCAFDQSEVAFLGHMVSKEGVSVGPRKTEAIAKYPT